MNNRLAVPDSLLKDVSNLIEDAKKHVAAAVNAELTLLYWQIGARINTEILQGARAEYGKEILRTLASELSMAWDGVKRN